MDTTQVALVVAGITAGTGFVQATIQSWISSRATRVAARQDAVKADLVLLQGLHEQLADMGQAANEYILEMHNDEFFTNERWADLRQPVVRQLTNMHGMAADFLEKGASRVITINTDSSSTNPSSLAIQW